MNSNHWFAIPLSLIVALMLTMLPMPDWTIWFRPAWVLLVLTYWSMMMPQYANVGTAWTVGLMLDVLNGTLLGEHALALTIAIYFVVRMHSQLRMYTVLQQALWVFIFVMLYQFVLFCVQGFLGGLPKTWLYWSSSATSMLLWPWVYIIMRAYCRHLKMA